MVRFQNIFPCCPKISVPYRRAKLNLFSEKGNFKHENSMKQFFIKVFFREKNKKSSKFAKKKQRKK
jgi:hypothetical protein